jgi:hypothetical protein
MFATRGKKLADLRCFVKALVASARRRTKMREERSATKRHECVRRRGWASVGAAQERVCFLPRACDLKREGVCPAWEGPMDRSTGPFSYFINEINDRRETCPHR